MKDTKLKLEIGKFNESSGEIIKLSGDSCINTNGKGIVIGDCSVATGNNSFAGGFSGEASGTYSVAMGGYNQATSFGAVAIGGSNKSCGGYYAVTIGGRNTSCGSCAVAIGHQNFTYGAASVALNSSNVACGANSLAVGFITQAIGSSSFAEGSRTKASGAQAHSAGFCTIASGNSSHAGGTGVNTKEVLAFGIGTFNHSTNDASQVVGHGALPANSAILGGINHNIEVGNTGATIIGGNAIKLTGTTYIDTTAVANLALMSVPTSGSSDQVLVRNISTGLVDYVSKASLGGSLTASNGLSVCSDNVVLGGTLTGDTCIATGSWGSGYGLTVGHCSQATAFGAFSHGYFACAIGEYSHAEGYNTKAYGYGSHAEGSGSHAIANYSHAEGFSTKACAGSSHAEGGGTTAIGETSHAEGGFTHAIGNYSHAEGRNTCTFGCASHSGGLGWQFSTEKFIIAGGDASFNHSRNNASQILGHGALAVNSAILGGLNHNIATGNTGATIIGGSTIKLTGTTYIDTTAVSNLAIMSVPTNNVTTDQVLVRNTSTGLVDYVSKASIGGGADYLRADICDCKSGGNLRFNDDISANFGNTDDMCITHIASDSTSRIVVSNGVGTCFILQGGGNEALSFIPDGKLQLFDAGQLKFETASFGTCTIGTLCAGVLKAPLICATTAIRTSAVGLTTCLTSGCGCAVDWIAVSDCRCKTCIEPYECGLDKVNQLKPVKYEWKHDNSEDIGFIAQDVLDVEDKLVVGSDEDGYGLKYDKFSAIMVKAIQELSITVLELKLEIEELKNNK